MADSDSERSAINASSNAGLSRRRLIQGLGAAALAGVGSVVAAPPARGAPSTAAASGGCPLGQALSQPSATFGRMFDLPGFATNSAGLRAALTRLGKPGGLLDAKDNLYGPGGGALALLQNPALSRVNRDNPRDTAGMTFMAQFIAHDLTFDADSKLGVTEAPNSSPNNRSPRLDLDSLYGRGPVAQPELYDPAHPIKFLVESGGRFEDLPRRPDNTAIISDPRNDQNLILSGLAAAFLKFHNNAVDAVTRSAAEPIDTFRLARRQTTWHYQWLVVNRILPTFVGQSLVDDIMRGGPRFFRPAGQPNLPVEFAVAAYRFGHSMIRPSYVVNLSSMNGAPFFALMFDEHVVVPDGQNPTTDPGDLRGGFRAARRYIDWQPFFDFGGRFAGQAKPAKRIDTILATPLFSMPTRVLAHIPGDPGPISLAQRDLLRHLTFAVPSGQAIAKRMQEPALSRVDLGDFGDYGYSLATSTPLWLYVLREAEAVHDGLYLGPVGGRIVAEVIIELLRADPDSYLNAPKRWRPSLGASGDDYEIGSFLTFAGVDPARRGY